MVNKSQDPYRYTCISARLHRYDYGAKWERQEWAQFRSKKKKLECPLMLLPLDEALVAILNTHLCHSAPVLDLGCKMLHECCKFHRILPHSSKPCLIVGYMLLSSVLISLYFTPQQPIFSYMHVFLGVLQWQPYRNLNTPRFPNQCTLYFEVKVCSLFLPKPAQRTIISII